MIEDFRPAFDAAPSAALKGGKPLVYVCPPAGWMIAPWYERVLDGMNEGSLILALAPDTGSVLDVQRALGPRFPEHPIHAVTGLARAGRLLKKESVRTLVATAEDALYLFQRSALKPETIEHLALLWPELMTDSAKECVDSILADVQKAKRFIATQSPTSVQELLERIAHRAPVMDAVPASETPVDQVRYAVVDESRRIEAARAALDIMDPETTLIWHPHPSDSWRALAGQADVELHEDASLESYSLAVAAELPTAEILRGLADAASQVLVFVRPDQISWLTTAAGTLKPLPLPGGADLVRSEAQATREILRRVLETEPPASQLLAIEPLLAEYDPALVAAAALTLRTHAPKPIVQTAEKEGTPQPSTRLFLSVGTTDGVRAADIVGTIVRNAKIDAQAVGKIDVRERFTLVDVPTEHADHVMRSVQGQKIRNRRATIRVDRPPPRR